MQAVTCRALGGVSLVRSVAGRGVGGGASSVGRRCYHDNIVEHYENPRNVGSMDKDDKFVGTVRTLNFSGDVVLRLFVLVRAQCHLACSNAAAMLS